MNIVTIGGGGGHAQVLKGIKHLSNITITGICPSTDSGGSTGDLIRDYHCLGYLGDLTKCIAALCPDEKLATALRGRFKGGCLDGHSLKNLLLLGLSHLDSMTSEEALACMHRMCGILPHRVLPVTMEHAELCAKLKFGGKVNGETQIDRLAGNPLWSADRHGIRSMYLRPAVPASPLALRAIDDADFCVICPGDLFTSVIPVLLPTGIKRTFQQTQARIVVILNIMTKRGETDGYHAEDFIDEIEKQIGRPCDTIVLNRTPIPEASLLNYRAEEKIELSSGKLKRDARLIKAPLLGITPEGHLCHDPTRTAQVLEKIFGTVC